MNKAYIIGGKENDMRWNILPLLCLVLGLGAVEIDLSEVELPKGVVEIRADLDEDLSEARVAYLKSVEEAKDRALKRIEREERRERDALVKLKIAQVVKEVGEIGAVDIFGKPVVAFDIAELEGTWLVEKHNWNGKWTFNNDGTLSTIDGPRKWEVVKDKIIITWGNNTASMSLPIDGKSTGFAADGSDLSFTKQ